MIARLLLACALLLGQQASTAAEERLWFEQERPNASALQAVAALASAAQDGLDPQDYDAQALSQALAASAQGKAAIPIEALEKRLGEAVQRYLSDLHFGRVDPHKVHENFTLPAPAPLDAAALLRAAVEQQRLPQALREAAPAIPLYASLRSALARYRELSISPLWQLPLPAFPGKKLEPGHSWAGCEALLLRLVALGDLPPMTALPANYEGALVDGVKAFQSRHGIEPDGMIGKDTLAQLAVTPAQRVRQIELTMERLRWTPLLAGPRMVVVNVPEFVLRAYEVRDGHLALGLESRIIVGAALKTSTPLFSEAMRFIEFSPYWNVPPSIARAELVPRLRRDPGYFEREGFEFVSGQGGASTALSSANLAAVLRGEMRLRQRPGPKNALGQIKFVFPNSDNIYLHDTPAHLLFARARRDFSHGCIRVEQPLALAKFVLQGDAEWTEPRIREAMAKGQSSTLRLAQTLPVVIAYATVVVKGERVYFFQDIYGHDRLLDQALQQRKGVLPATPTPKPPAR